MPLVTVSRDVWLMPYGQDTKRYESLQQACSSHAALALRSASGHGYDRHLMSLKVLLRPGETHQVFEDEMYAKSQEWKLSSSGLTAGTKFMGGQFGSAWPDGYSVSCKWSSRCPRVG